MMRSFYMLTLVAALAACGSAQQEVQSNPATANDSTTVAAYSTLDTIVPFSGLWVNENYVISVLKSKSPAATNAPAEACINIPGRTLQYAGMIYGFHEGGGYLVFVKQADHYEMWGHNFSDSQSGDADSVLNEKRGEVQILTDKRIKIGDTHFVKLLDKDPGNTPILEELLFKGKYLDAVGKPVEFAASGSVTGLPGISYYYPFIDYTMDESPVDKMYLGPDSETRQQYGFKFVSDSLIIYKLKCIKQDTLNNICAVEAFAEPVFQFKKQ